MKSISLAVLLSLCFCSAIFAQNPYVIKGIVADTANNSKLQNATISILNAKDSTLYKFTRANAAGSFAVSPMKKGNFILLLTYPDYADYVSQFSLDSTKSSIDFKQINMKLKATLLNEVLIKGQGAAIKIKGDTTEFNAASYTIQPNDKVEDLLKKLPGIQIDKDGKITAQGKTVPKVLVDGEEFFGDDPTLVTKNLRADMVDKIQLFDKTSDQAAFTGVDDGEKQKTINIKLKEDKKNGYFGKVMAGKGTDNFYQGQGMFNRFKAKQKFSLYGTSSNTGKTGLGYGDSEKFGSSSSEMVEYDGGMYFSSGGGDDLESWGGQYYGEGIPKAHNGGAHYDSKWNSDKESINANYKIGSLNVKGAKNILSQRNNPDEIVNTNSDQLMDNYIFRQKLDAIYQIKLDTTSNLKITVDGTLKNNETTNSYATIGTRGDNSLLNKSTRTVDNNGNEQVFNISAFYTKKLKKAGRTFSANLKQSLNQKNNEGFLKSKNEFYSTAETLDSIVVVDQFKDNDIRTSVFTSNFTYTEPLSKSLSLIANYGISFNNNRAVRKSFNASSPNNYNVLDKQYSNDFDADQTINQGGAIFNYKKNKMILNWGTKVSAVNFNQYEAYSDVRYKRSFLNWIPQASFQYKFSNQRSFRFGYNGYTTQPTVDQLQPVKVNTDQFNIPEGNPNLKPSYNNSLNVSYSSYKVLSNQSLYLNARFGFANNQIVNDVTTFSGGRSIFRPINLTNKTPLNYSAYLDFSRKIKPVNLNLGFSLNEYGATSFNYVDKELNKTIANDISGAITLNKSKEEKYEIYAYYGPTYSIQQTSLQKDVNNNGWGTGGNFSFVVFLPGKFQLKSDADYQYKAKTESFNQKNEQLLLNASIVKTFFKEKSLMMTISGNDLLNQNQGFNRSASSNTITQTTYSTIKRYFMFSVSWDFNKMGGITK